MCTCLQPPSLHGVPDSHPTISLNRLLISGVDPAREFSCIVVDEVGQARAVFAIQLCAAWRQDASLPTHVQSLRCEALPWLHAAHSLRPLCCRLAVPPIPVPSTFFACGPHWHRPQVHLVDDASRGALYELLLSKLRYLQARAEHRARDAAPAAAGLAAEQAAMQGAAPEQGPSQLTCQDAQSPATGPAAAPQHQQQHDPKRACIKNGSQAAGCGGGGASSSADPGPATFCASQAAVRACDWIQLVAMSATVPGARAMARWLAAEYFCGSHRPKELRRYLVGCWAAVYVLERRRFGGVSLRDSAQCADAGCLCVLGQLEHCRRVPARELCSPACLAASSLPCS